MTWLTSWFHRRGKGVLELPAERVLAVGRYLALPTAHQDFRGALARVQGGAGVADTLYVGRKNASDAYEWREVAGAAVTNQSKTIATGVVTLDEIASSVLLIELSVATQGGAATDDLDTINVTGTVAAGTFLLLRTADANDPTVTEAGNINLATAGTFTFDAGADRLLLVRSGSTWVELSRSNNA